MDIKLVEHIQRIREGEEELFPVPSPEEIDQRRKDTPLTERLEDIRRIFAHRSLAYFTDSNPEVQVEMFLEGIPAVSDNYDELVSELQDEYEERIVKFKIFTGTMPTLEEYINQLIDESM